MAEKAVPGSLDLGRTIPLVPPLYQTSVYTVPDLDTYDRIINGEEPGYFYARDSHPNARHLAQQIAEWEGASWAAVCGSGMAHQRDPLVAHSAGRPDRCRRLALWPDYYSFETRVDSLRRANHFCRRRQS